jgi:hypothetical protein
MSYSFHPDAEIEFTQAIDYYEDHQRKLGFEFSIEVLNTIQRIIANPESWTSVSRSIRRALVLRFPFGVSYHYSPIRTTFLSLL